MAMATTMPMPLPAGPIASSSSSSSYAPICSLSISQPALAATPFGLHSRVACSRCTAIPEKFPTRHFWTSHRLVSRSPRAGIRSVAEEVKETVNVEEWNEQFRKGRLKHLEAQALEALEKAVETFQNPTFPCALIAGDVVILDLLNRLHALNDGTVKVVFIDTFHLFPETYTFLKLMEDRYNFQSHVFHAASVDTKDDYFEKYGTDLYLRDIDEYDKICKVEPFNRALATLEADVMINGRRRDHGAERAHLEIIEVRKPRKLQPLAYWEFRDCWDYLLNYKIPYHPLHDQGFPSIGDVQSTIPVPKDKWFEYGGERSGRFQGLKNKDGSLKTECGIHVESE